MRKNEIYIVSLTTFPARINEVWLAIETILRQTKKPSKIILWLYKGEFEGKESLPMNLLRLEKRGLEIRFCDENLMPHKKYYYTMLEYPEANVITIDDDMFYPPDLISKIVEFHEKYPKAIICPITRQIKVAKNIIKPYKEWEYLKSNTTPNINNLTMGGGGTLFPPYSLHGDYTDLNALKELSLKADDLWLKIMSLKNNIKVVSMAGEYTRFFIPILRKQNIRLMDTNFNEGHNDLVFSALIEYYKIPVTIFEEY
jgi:hypothetical protein